MGYDIKKNKKGLYKVKSTTSDKTLHPKGWITEDELKKILIEVEYSKFIRSVIEIDFEFPSDYYINNHREFIEDLHNKGKLFVIKNWNNDDIIEKKFREIIERLKVKL